MPNLMIFTPIKVFYPLEVCECKKMNFCYLDSNKLQYLIKNGMKTNFFSKKVGFIAQNFYFYLLKTFSLPPEHL